MSHSYYVGCHEDETGEFLTIELKIGNRFTEIKYALKETIKTLNDKLSFRVAGRHFSTAYQEGKWTGRQYLMRFSKKNGYRFPSGLVHMVRRKLRDMQLAFTIKNNKKRNAQPKEYNWNTDIKLRDYQKQAVKAIMDNAGCGILKMAIRSGKTKTSAGVIWALNSRTIFIVPSQLLLYQTKESLEETLLEEVGVVGGGVWDERNITVATVQTLTIARASKRFAGEIEKEIIKVGEDKEKTEQEKTELQSKLLIQRDACLERYKAYQKIINNYDLVIFDECHHVAQNEWKNILMEFDCPFKVGLSATVFLTHDKERERGIMWLAAACGPIVYTLEMSELIEMGHLLAPEIRLYTIKTPDLKKEKWSQDLLKAGIYENEYRNNKIVKVAEELASDGYRVLVVTNRKSQIRALEGLFAAKGINIYTVVGDTENDERTRLMDAFVRKERSIMISTVISEGVDLPEVEVVINGDGGSDIKSCIQKMRNLTPAKGKTDAIYIDFVDLTSKYFAKHTKNRLDVYRSEPLFNIRVMSDS